MQMKNRITGRQRSGSFDGRIEARVKAGTFGLSSRQAGTLDYHHSATRQTTTVSTLKNTSASTGAPVAGVGSGLMNHVESIAKSHGANMVEATAVARTAQGFYQKVGYSPNPDQYEAAKHALAPDFAGDPGGLHSAARTNTAVWEKPV